jgi:hypothetical protein
VDALSLPATDYALALAALLWIGSVFLLGFAARGYFAARARSRASPPKRTQEPALDVAAAFPPSADRPVVGSGSARVEATEPTRPGAAYCLRARTVDEVGGEDQRPPAAMTRSFAARESSREDLVAAVSSRAAGDPGAAHGLADLVRALYLDQSNFRFETIAALGDADRRLAMLLIEEWLADPSAIDFWQAMHATLDGPARAARAAQHA